MADLLPNLAIERRPLSALVPYARNAKKHPEAQLAKLVSSLREFGWTFPILVDETGEVIAGYGRLLAAQRILQHGWKIPDWADTGFAPTLCRQGLSEAQKKAYRLLDNRVAEEAGWDKDLLTLELEALNEANFDLDLTGFDASELANLLPTKEGQGLTDDDAVPALKQRTITQPGDLWVLGNHRLLCGDSCDPTQVAKLLDGRPADAIWTDPPYNVAVQGQAGTILNDDMSDAAFLAFMTAAMRSAYAALRPGGAIYVAHAETERLNFTLAFRQAGLKLSSCLIWRKNQFTLGRADYQWQHEPILYGWKPGAPHVFYGGRNKTTIVEWPEDIFEQISDDTWQITVGDRTLLISGQDVQVAEGLGSVLYEDKPKKNPDHPTMKPVALVERMLRNSALKGDTVLDLFGGSGSTLIACEKLGMHARLMELDPRFADVIVTRWQEYTGCAPIRQAFSSHVS